MGESIIMTCGVGQYGKSTKRESAHSRKYALACSRSRYVGQQMRYTGRRISVSGQHIASVLVSMMRGSQTTEGVIQGCEGEACAHSWYKTGMVGAVSVVSDSERRSEDLRGCVYRQVSIYIMCGTDSYQGGTLRCGEHRTGRSWGDGGICVMGGERRTHTHTDIREDIILVLDCRGIIDTGGTLEREERSMVSRDRTCLSDSTSEDLGGERYCVDHSEVLEVTCVGYLYGGHLMRAVRFGLSVWERSMERVGAGIIWDERARSVMSGTAVRMDILLGVHIEFVSVESARGDREEDIWWIFRETQLGQELMNAVMERVWVDSIRHGWIAVGGESRYGQFSPSVCTGVGEWGLDGDVYSGVWRDSSDVFLRRDRVVVSRCTQRVETTCTLCALEIAEREQRGRIKDSDWVEIQNEIRYNGVGDRDWSYGAVEVLIEGSQYSSTSEHRNCGVDSGVGGFDTTGEIRGWGVK
ncbi:hypothetical protein Tco_0304553 [Tanacetum coccineum]